MGSEKLFKVLLTYPARNDHKEDVQHRRDFVNRSPCMDHHIGEASSRGMYELPLPSSGWCVGSKRVGEREGR